MAMRWRIYYADGSTFDSSQGEHEDAPPFGVICIVYPNDLVGRIIMHGWDWYYWVPGDGQHCQPRSPRTGQWWGSDIYGVLDRLLHNLPLCALKQGRNASNERYRQIMAAADKDPDFPPRSGKLAGERPLRSAKIAGEQS